MKHLLFLDIETTGLNPDHAALLELSAVRVSLDAKQESAVFDELVDPETEIPVFITKLTGISQQMVKGAKSLEQVREEFQQYLQSGDVICGHNIQFDTGFLKAKGFDIPNQTLDTFPLSNVLLPNEQSYSLEILTKTYDIHHEDAHRALADVKANIDLYRVLLNKARQLPQSLLAEYKKVIAKTEWTGSLLFEQVTTGSTKQAQTSLFESSESLATPKSLASRLMPAQERMIAEQISTKLQTSANTLITLPADISDIRTATEAVRLFVRYKNSPVALAVPKIADCETPEGFYRFAAQDKIICRTLFDKWLEKSVSLQEDEVTAAMKILRTLDAGTMPILADIPMVRGEREVAEKWLSAEHVRCPSHCPAKANRLNAVGEKMFLCEYSDLTECPAANVILLTSDKLDSTLDVGERRNFALGYTEKWLEQKSIKEPQFAESTLFTIGLLKRFIRERVGDSPYRSDLSLSAELLSHPELINLATGLREAGITGIRYFPDEKSAANRLIELSEILSTPLDQNEYRFVSIYPDENLFITSAPTLLQPVLDQYLKKAKQVVFLGSCFLKSGDKFRLGGDLITPEEQIDIPSEFDFQKYLLFSLVSFGGNNKNSNTQLTAALVREILPMISGHLLVIFPGYGIAEKFSEEITAAAESFGFRILFANNSSGKISSQLGDGKSILIATASNWSKIDFGANQFEGCIQHRILFEPPSDPATIGRQGDVKNEFQEVALPKAIRSFQRQLASFTMQQKPFFWLCLDSHFTKQGGFADAFLQNLPASLPIHRTEITRMPLLVKDFLNRHESEK